MEMRRSGPHRVHILLTRDDLSEMNLSYDALNPNDPKTQELLLLLLDAAWKRERFSPRGKLLMELHPDGAGGCTASLCDLFPAPKRWKVRRPVRTPVIYRFSDVDILIESAVKLFRRCSHRIRKSALYRMGGEWRLVIYPLDTVENITLSFLDEYAPRCGEGPLAAAWLDEYGELLVACDAVDLLSAYFG